MNRYHDKSAKGLSNAVRSTDKRHRLDDNRYRFTSGKQTQRRHDGRGHQDFTVERCS
ncbi:hypothetical protein [Virgisporangium aliadipatigenens]|uniref:hypothetical protein n=1 Tax=Virgisporangium aliadipatigenens TaxID=741659 RepID=UPI00194493F0|nr:hypothetical protein [Virgisporangium aliadipatigenens]